MRIALIADTHGALDERIADGVRDADLLVHAGDVGNGIAAAVESLAAQQVIVHGNNDPADTVWPQSRQLDLPGGELAVIHGHQWPSKGRHRKLREAFPGARAVVCGHSHRRVVDDAATPWILNPGAAGRTRAYGGPGYISIIAGAGEWQIQIHRFEPIRRRRR